MGHWKWRVNLVIVVSLGRVFFLNIVHILLHILRIEHSITYYAPLFLFVKRASRPDEPRVEVVNRGGTTFVCAAAALQNSFSLCWAHSLYPPPYWEMMFFFQRPSRAVKALHCIYRLDGQYSIQCCITDFFALFI